jgi:hypothetical protein
MEPTLFDSVHVPPALHERRERVFLVFAGIFLGSMTMLNILGITRFIHIGPLALAVGVLPYPLTFLCTDFISEFYGKRRANFVVWVGLLLNCIVLAFLWLGHQVPPIGEAARPALANAPPGDADGHAVRGIRERDRPVRGGVPVHAEHGVRFDARVPGGAVLRRVLVSLLEEADQGQAPVAPQQRLDDDLAARGLDGGHLYHVLGPVHRR